MRVGFNLLFLLPGVVGGSETFAAGLMEALSELDDDNEYCVFLNGNAAAWPLPASRRFQRVVCDFDARFRPTRILLEHTWLPRSARRHGIDVMHSLGNVSPIGLHCPSVVSIYDLNYRFVIKSPIKRYALRFLVERSARQATFVIVPSEYSRRAIGQIKGVSQDRMRIVYGAPPLRPYVPRAGDERVLSRLGLEPPYLCAYAGPSPHKNLEPLIEVVASLNSKQELPGPLVVIGHAPDSLRSYAVKLGVERQVIFTEYIDQESASALVKNALMLVFPSLHEGFGLPVVEAMALGCPVVSSDRTSLPEVGGDAAVYFDPTSLSSMEEAIIRVANDQVLREEMIRRGRLNQERFSWRTSARRCAEIYSLAHDSSRRKS